jgi:predicted  nucleic acid-binding Zn-ribbon protein
MAGPGVIFREVHRLQKTVRDLREQIDRFPHQLKAQKTKVARHEQMLQEAQDALKRLKVKTHEREVTLKGKHQQIKKYEDQQRGATSSKEYEAFKHEIDHARQECDQLEEEILTALGEIDEKTAALPELEKALAQARQEATRFEATAKERQGALQQALAVAQQQLKETETQIPPNIRAQYDRVVQARGADALTPARDKACGACSTELTAQTVNDLLVGAFVVCKSCGRILYAPA